jgi:Ca-activated chloride channel family protein
MRILSRALFVALLVLLVTVTGRAAGVLLQGTVVDPAGVAIPGATVELFAGSKAVGKTVSGADGTFKFAAVAAGNYEIHVTLNGFRQTRAAITIGASAPPPLRLKLLIGSVSETVTVDAKGAGVPGGVEGGVPGGVVGGVVGGLPSAPAPPPPPPASAPAAAPGRGQGSSTAYLGAARAIMPTPFAAADTESYAAIEENKFRRAVDQPLSTFSIDVDTASYANVRRFLNEGHLPPADAVRIEELINYFHFDYADAMQGAPFGVTTEVVPCPWNSRHRLALIGLQARRLPEGRTPPRNLVFLLDVSGSMATSDKLPLVKNAMKMLAETLTSQDRVAIVTYAGTTGVALPATRGDRNAVIQDAISSLGAGGSTNGGAGIQLAYQIANENFVKGGINRVILATDGDFNVGITSMDDLTRLIEERRTSGVFLSVLGVGTGNLTDATMEKLADKGNGNYSYLDSLTEARKVLVAEAGSTLVTVAKDVKIQVEFNPAQVGAYRLVGYENRRLKARDFNDDAKDAGEMGAGHSVTALYEIVPAGEDVDAPGIDPLKYQRPETTTARVAVPSTELMTVKVRYKKPDGDRSSLVTVPVAGHNTTVSKNIGFAGAVAEFGMLLRDSAFKADATWADAVRLASSHRGEDTDGYRAEFVRLVELAASLDRQRTVGSVSRR